MANLTRFDPFGEMLTLREAINGLFEDSVVRPAAVRGAAPAMPLDVAETQDGYVVEAALPGVKPEDLDISLQDNVLTITAEVRQAQNGDGQANYHRVERRYGRMSRAISLPSQVQSDKVQASLEHGVLHIEIPKAEALKPRKITINTNTSQPSQPIDVESNEVAASAA